jgi:FlaA1/EpsC-like NDP-sugar epimerase
VLYLSTDKVVLYPINAMEYSKSTDDGYCGFKKYGGLPVCLTRYENKMASRFGNSIVLKQIHEGHYDYRIQI